VDAAAIFQAVAARVPGAGALVELQPGGGGDGPRDGGFKTTAAALAQVMAALRDEPSLRFDFLQNMTAVDWPKRGAIEVVYHLYSYVHRHELCVRVEVPRGDPVVPSLTPLWRTADWLEREQYDLMGVIFEGHPDLRRLLMPDDWIGHPLRKDYHEPKSYRGMPTSRPSPLDLLAEYDRHHPGGGGEPGSAS
jgi:NADH-quinone oxidoreductase subunit C